MLIEIYSSVTLKIPTTTLVPCKIKNGLPQGTKSLSAIKINHVLLRALFSSSHNLIIEQYNLLPQSLTILCCVEQNC